MARTHPAPVRAKAALAAISALALASCDAATQIAGEAVEGEVRNAIAAQCQQVAENAGIVAGRVAEVCACSAERFLAEAEPSLATVSRERIEAVVNACAQQTGAASAGSDDTWNQNLPAEEIGG